MARFAAACRRTMVVLAIALGLASSAHADVRVEGTPAALRVTIDHAPIGDVLTAVTDSLKIAYRTAVPLDAKANGTYAGSLAQVLSRLLGGYNYVIKRHGESRELVVFGRRGEMTIPPPVPRVKLPTSILSRAH